MAKQSTKSAVEPAPETPTKSPMDKKVAMDLLYQMLLIRRFEEKAAELYSQGKTEAFCTLPSGWRPRAWGRSPRCGR